MHFLKSLLKLAIVVSNLFVLFITLPSQIAGNLRPHCCLDYVSRHYGLASRLLLESHEHFSSLDLFRDRPISFVSVDASGVELTEEVGTVWHALVRQTHHEQHQSAGVPRGRQSRQHVSTVKGHNLNESEQLIKVE